VVCNCVNVRGLRLDVIRMSLARRSQDWHARVNEVTNSSTIASTRLELERLDDRWQEDGGGGWWTRLGWQKVSIDSAEGGIGNSGCRGS
jgi:hypothetical protein